MTIPEHSACRLIDYFTVVSKSHHIIRIGRTHPRLQFDTRAEAATFANRHDMQAIAVNPYGFVIHGNTH